MNVNKFFSAGIVVRLPSKSNPKVYLAIDDSQVAKSSFELYNPFSYKAKILKSLTFFLSVYANNFAKLVLPTQVNTKSQFLSFLEVELGKSLISSVYLATDGAKVVLQLQDVKGVIGYLKYAFEPLAQRRLTNEQKAIKLLSEAGIVAQTLTSGFYENKPYLILKPLNGEITKLKHSDYKNILNLFKKDARFTLKNHPRIENLRNKLLSDGLHKMIPRLDRAIATSTTNYFEVWEHGDFAPWNLIKDGDRTIPFDFEFFEEVGLEYLDEIKYHFQIENLLNGKAGGQLLSVLEEKIQIQEFRQIMEVFLIKEILIKTEIGSAIDLEEELLRLLNT